MELNPKDLSIPEMYQHMVSFITPRPIAWVSTISNEGIGNLAPFSFFNGVSASPPTLIFSPVNRRDGSKKDTILNIEQNGEFVVSVVSYANAQKMNLSSADFPSDDDEAAACDLETLPSKLIKPTCLKVASVNLECKLLQIVNIGEGPLAANLVIGEIVYLHIDDSILNEKGAIDPLKLDNVGRLGGASYATTRDLFDLPRPEMPKS